MPRRIPSAQIDAIAFARASIGADLRQARLHAGLTQAELAGKVKQTELHVGQVERGDVDVDERYVSAVLIACGLPLDWKPTT